MKRCATRHDNEWHALQVVNGAIPDTDDHPGALQQWTESLWMKNVAVWVLSGRDVPCHDVPTCVCDGSSGPSIYPPNLRCLCAWMKSAAEVPNSAQWTNPKTLLLTASCCRLEVGQSTEIQIIAPSRGQLGQNAAISAPLNGRRVALPKKVDKDFEFSTGYEYLTQLQNIRASVSFPEARS